MKGFNQNDLININTLNLMKERIIRQSLVYHLLGDSLDFRGPSTTSTMRMTKNEIIKHNLIAKELSRRGKKVPYIILSRILNKEYLDNLNNRI